MNDFQRRVGLLLAAVGVLVLASATYGVSTIAADRIADVGTASDDTAYLSIDEASSSTVDGTSPGTAARALTLTNEFQTALRTLEVSIVAVGGQLTPGDLALAAPESLTAGASGDVSIYCAAENGATSSGPISVTIDIEGSGDGATIATDETIDGVDVACPSTS